MYSSIRNSPIIFICITYTICTFITVKAVKWPTKEEELLDEKNDEEILKAVQKSMAEWNRSHHTNKTMMKYHRHHITKRADKVACYDELGCFEESGPFGYFDMLPASPEEINTKFYFYSTENRSDKPLVELPYANMSNVWKEFENENDDEKLTTKENKTRKNIPSKNWNSLKSLKGLDKLSIRIIVHGFGSSCPHVWIYEMRAALMAVEECIVICVDWENGANLPNYVRAAANTRIIGKQLALLIKGLQKYKGLDLSRVHVIGFSLGAHASGFAGAELPGLQRITGLDPAGPLFEAQHPKARLDSTDAQFVDVIHSNGENLILGGLGSWQPMGHVDFYPNGGRVQNGCSNLFVGAVTDFIWSPAATVEGRSLCNHRRAYKFFIDSVASRCLFPAFPCDSYDDFIRGECFPCNKMQETETDSKCGNMGYYADRSTGRGQLYLITREEEPFCAHQFHMEIYSSENDLPLRTLGKLEAILEGDGYLNETFSITEKEDTEFFAGDLISRIIVPHPALGFPHSITLTYKSYSGWLSKGLPHWVIHKIVLTDSFGKSMSLCKRHIYLESGKPVYISLKPGICHVPDENDINYALQQYEEKLQKQGTINRSDVQNSEGTENIAGNATDETDDDNVEKSRNKKEIIDLGTTFKMLHNNTYSLVVNESESSNTNLPWQPILDGENLLEKDAIESSRKLLDNNEVIAPTIVTRPSSHQHHHKERKLHTDDENNDEYDVGVIVEPILKDKSKRKSSTKTKAKHYYEDEIEQKNRDNNSFFTVQLLPFRLGELIERAERYARETLLPLISEQAPRFFGFNFGNTDRTPKYFPSLTKISNENPSDDYGERIDIALPPTYNKSIDNEGLDEIDDDDDDDDDKDIVINETISNYTENLTESERVKKSSNNHLPQLSEDLLNDQLPAESQTNYYEARNIKDLLSILRPKIQSSNPSEHQERSISINNQNDNNNNNNNHLINNYYTNLDRNGSLIKIESDVKGIKIDLPTYRPPISKNIFPYKFEYPATALNAKINITESKNMNPASSLV